MGTWEATVISGATADGSSTVSRGIIDSGTPGTGPTEVPQDTSQLSSDESEESLDTGAQRAQSAQTVTEKSKLPTQQAPSTAISGGIIDSGTTGTGPTEGPQGTSQLSSDESEESFETGAQTTQSARTVTEKSKLPTQKAPYTVISGSTADGSSTVSGEIKDSGTPGTGPTEGLQDTSQLSSDESEESLETGAQTAQSAQTVTEESKLPTQQAPSIAI